MKVLKRVLMLAFLVTTTVGFYACGGDKPSHEFSGVVSDPPQQVTDFSLTDQYDQEFTFSGGSEEISLIFFGYTLCPDVCPTTLADLVRVKRLLGDDAKKVSFIWVTVDPERDSPYVLRQRIAAFDPEFIGLSGTREELQPVWEDFGVIANRDDTQDSAAGYLISHSAFTYLVDSDRTIRVVFPFGADPANMAADAAFILNEKQ
jgi:protein SCO1/2